MKRLSREYRENRVRILLGQSRNPAFRIVKRGTISENPEFNKAFQKLVLNGRDGGEVKAFLQELQEDFSRTSMYRENVLRHGRRGVFMEYLLGLPSLLSVPYFYGDMADFIVEVTGEQKVLDLDPWEVDFFYWAHVEYAIHTLLREHGLRPMGDLDIIY